MGQHQGRVVVDAQDDIGIVRRDLEGAHGVRLLAVVGADDTNSVRLQLP